MLQKIEGKHQVLREQVNGFERLYFSTLLYM